MKKFEKEFEQNNLKIDQERILTYSRLICPFDCTYCFVEDISPSRERSALYLSERQLDLLEHLPENIQLIMLGCDTEFFQSKANFLEVLNRLANIGKDISVVTKMPLGENLVNELRRINIRLEENGNSLTFSESIPCLKSSSKWEPKAPAPLKRIDTLRRVFESGVKTLVAIRPLLPDVPNDELEEIIHRTKNYCFGYYSGPLYMKSLTDPALSNIDLRNLQIEKMQPDWMLKGNKFFKIEDRAKMKFLEKTIEENDRKLFEGAAETIAYLREHEKSGN